MITKSIEGFLVSASKTLGVMSGIVVGCLVIPKVYNWVDEQTKTKEEKVEKKDPETEESEN